MSLKWIPNALTLLRIGAAPFVAYILYLMFTAEQSDAKEHYAFIVFLVFIIAAVTDWFDGFFARKLNATSPLGAKLDLWADKIIVFAVLVGCLPFLPVLAIFGLIALSVRDIIIMRLRAKRPDVNLKATFMAKSKTAVVMTGMAMAMGGYAFTLQAQNAAFAETADLMNLVTRLGLSMYTFGCVLSLGTAFQYIQAARAQTPDSTT